MIETLLVLVLTSSLIACSYKHILPFFVSEIQETSRAVRAVFALTTGISFLVFFLIMCEFGDWIPSIRSMSWHVSISALLVLMVVVLPLSLDYSYFSEGAGVTTRYKHCCTILAFGAQLYFFYRIGDFIPEGQTNEHSFLASCVLRVGFLGISAMALVSGFGAVSALWSVFSKRRVVSDFEVTRLRQSIDMSHEQIAAKSRLLTKVEARHAQDESLLARLIGSSPSQEIVNLQDELSAMQDLHSALIADLVSMQAALDDQARAQTVTGFVLNSFDVLFAFYCVYRISATIYNLTPWKQVSSVDPVSQLLSLIVVHYDENIDRETWSRMVGFLLSGVVIVGSLRACLLVLARMSKILPRLINQQSMALLFACLIGSYNVATAIVLCRNLPSAYGRNILSNLGASLDQSRFDIWFDSVFLLGVFFTGLILFIQRKLSGSDLGDTATVYEKSV